MSWAEFEATSPAQKGLQNYAFDRAATAIGEKEVLALKTSTSGALRYSDMGIKTS
jgi:hypothetical protein